MKKLIIPIAALIVLGGFTAFYMTQETGIYEKEIERINNDNIIEEIDLKTMADGTYSGTVETDGVKAVVEVTILGGKITAIDILEHAHGRKEASEEVAEKIIAQQKIMVDAVTGSTASSMIIQEGVLKALTGE